MVDSCGGCTSWLVVGCCWLLVVVGGCCLWLLWSLMNLRC